MLVQLDPEMFLNLRFTRAAETDKEYRSMENIEIPRFYYSIKFILVRMIQKIQNEFTQTIVQLLLLDNLEFHDTLYLSLQG